MKQKLLYLIFSSIVLLGNYAQASAPPPAQFSASVYSGCGPLTVSFFNSSSGNGTYSWNFGDPLSGPSNTSIDCSPIHTFNNAGTYNVVLTYVLGVNTYTATHTITVHPNPIADFTGQDSVCANNTLSYTASGAGLSYKWKALGGIISGPNNLATVNILWTTTGTQYVELTTTNAFGCKTTKRMYVLVVPEPRLKDFCTLPRKDQPNSTGEITNIGKPDSTSKLDETPCVCPGTIISFPAMDLSGNLLPNAYFNFTWNVTGASIVSGAGTNQVQLLIGNGTTFSVSLIVSSPFGCSDTGYCVFPICPAPKASFTATSTCLGSATNFNAGASTGASTYNWNFGDGNTLITNSSTASNTYQNPGTYYAHLTVSNASGCTKDTTIAVIISPDMAPPINCIGTVCHGQTKCYGTPYIGGASYAWTVTGGIGVPNTAGDSICVTWGNGPQGTIELVVTGGGYGCNHALANVPIFPNTINIYGPDTACIGSFVNFTTDLIPGSCYTWSVTDPGGNVYNLNPNTNPGNSTGFNVIPVGVYTVKLEMDNDITCCNGSNTFSFVVQGPLAISGPNAVCEGTTQTYTSNVPVSTWAAQGGTILSNTASSVTINWTTSGTGIVFAQVANPATTCNDYAQFKVTIHPKPLAAPIIGNTETCKGNTEIFSALTELSVTTVWSYTPTAGTVLLASSPNLQVKFNAVGTYNINAVYTSSFGCTNSVNHSISVIDTAKPNISGPATACIGGTQTFTIPSNPGNYWEWNIIGGEILATTSTSVTVQWGNISTGQVLLSHKLCGGIKFKLVPINAIPVGEITVSGLNCAGSSVQLCGPPTYTYNWSTGPSTQCITVLAPATSVSLTISKFGCSTTLTKSLVPFPKLPSPSFYLTQTCMPAPSTPLPIEITANPTPSGQTLSYTWSPTSGAGDTINKHYTTALSSTITCTATNQFGCTSTQTITTPSSCTITLPGGSGSPCTLTATPSFTYDPCTGLFTGSISLPAGVSAGAFNWNFNDGFYSNQMNPTHYFANLGTYDVQFNVYIYNGKCGTWVSIRNFVTVNYILRPKITHTFPTNCDYNTIQANYKPSSNIQATGTISYATNWGDGPGVSSGALPLNHTYAAPGTYVVTHTVSFNGCVKKAYDTVIIKPFKADFGFCNNSCIGESVQFYDKSESAVPIVAWAWNFGDGNTSNLQSPFHIFNSTGTFTVSLTITNQDGCTKTITYPITITTFNPGAATFTKNGIPIPSTSTFNICQGDVLGATAPAGYYYSWNTGGGTQVKNITTSGVYWCIVANGNGCKDTVGPFTVIVNPKPQAGIISEMTICSNTVAYLAAQSGVGYAYNWTASPTPASWFNTNTAAPYAYITSPGTYNFTLEVTNSFGCKDTTIKSILVNTSPSFSITPNTTGYVCEGDSVQLTANYAGAGTYLWSTGAITSSIWVKANGLYECTITNTSGCSTTQLGYVYQISPRPNLSNVPKGCYEVCEAAGNVKVCGPYAQSGQNFSYDWTLNGSTVATSSNLTITAAGDYQLTVIDLTTLCSSTSEIFNISYVASPIAQIINNSNVFTICDGQTGSIVLTAGPNPMAVTYNWYHNGTFVHTGTTYTAANVGTYTLVAWLSECCSDTAEIIIEPGECCFDPSTNFTIINDGTTYNSNTVWQGKYYVAGKVFVTGSAIFDMTLVDAVFDRDGEIIFSGTAIARINNSVLRPCELDSVWEGLTFLENSKGTVQETLFKNAVNAIYINSDKPNSVRITDNTFSNCNTGVRIKKSAEYTEGITRNSFVLDNTSFITPNQYGTTNFYGIHMTGTRMRELISHNSFKNSAFNKQSNMYHGIYAYGGSAIISENTFTNMYRGIDFVSAREQSNIENNEFEQTQYTKDYNFAVNAQIMVTNCEVPVLVFANELRNSNKDFQLNIAIYGANSIFLNIRDNNIKGFHYGIYTANLVRSTINENDLDNINAIGIYDQRSVSTSFNCNIIRLKISSGWGATSYGIGIYALGGNNSNRIFSNCIYDCKEAIRMQATGIGITMPQVYNNYMYNFYRAGIRNLGHIGNIGTAINPGRNTFISNNHGAGAQDIFSNVTITQACNQGATFNNTLVTNVTGACADGMFNSTASCGQIGVNGNKFRLNQWDVCDNYASSYIIIYQDGKDKLKLANTGDRQAAELSNELVWHAINMAAEMQDEPAFLDWTEELSKRNLDMAYNTYANAIWANASGNTSQAINLCLGIQFADSLAQENLEISRAEWEYVINGKLSAATRVNMARIDQNRGTNASLARDVLQAAISGHDYIFAIPNAEEVSDNRRIAANTINAYPNPTTDYTTVNVNVETESGLSTELYNLNGAIISGRVDDLSQGSFKIDMRNLAPGMYIVRVTNKDNGQVYTTKILKQNRN